jgi:hypothetical protein
LQKNVRICKQSKKGQGPLFPVAFAHAQKQPKGNDPQGDSPCHQHVIFTVMLILQSNLPENKSIAFALKQIYSINHTSAQAICCKIGVNPNNTLKN